MTEALKLASSAEKPHGKVRDRNATQRNERNMETTSQPFCQGYRQRGRPKKSMGELMFQHYYGPRTSSNKWGGPRVHYGYSQSPSTKVALGDPPLVAG